MRLAALVALGLAGAPLACATPTHARALPTTSGALYEADLDDRVGELERLATLRPDLTGNLERLSGALHLRGRLRSDLDDLQAGLDAATRCLEVEPESATCHLLRAEQGQSLHRFADARRDLRRARDLGADPARVAGLATDLDWSEGRYARAAEAIRAARRARPSLETWLREAQLEHDLGRDDAADAAFDAAEACVTDPSPFPLAHLYARRGIHLLDRGRLEEAARMLAEAVRRLPAYATAREHLAEALHALGRDEEALAVYEAGRGASPDPELLHGRAVVERALGHLPEAQALEREARRRYEALLVQYPEAMAWHAAETFAATGDHARAAALLRRDAAARTNVDTFVALGHEELALGNVARARAALDAARAAPVRSPRLDALALALDGR